MMTGFPLVLCAVSMLETSDGILLRQDSSASYEEEGLETATVRAAAAWESVQGRDSPGGKGPAETMVSSPSFNICCGMLSAERNEVCF